MSEATAVVFPELVLHAAGATCQCIVLKHFLIWGLKELSLRAGALCTQWPGPDAPVMLVKGLWALLRKWYHYDIKTRPGHYCLPSSPWRKGGCEIVQRLQRPWAVSLLLLPTHQLMGSCGQSGDGQHGCEALRVAGTKLNVTALIASGSFRLFCYFSSFVVQMWNPSHSKLSFLLQMLFAIVTMIKS